MVGRLVEHQQIARFEHHAGHRQPGPFTAREHLHLLVDVLAAEQERPQDVAQARADVAHGHPVEGVIDREFAVHQVVLVLRIVTYVDVGPQPDRPLGGGQLADEHPRKGRLALAVAAHQRDAVALADGEVRAAEHAFRAERHPGVLDFGHHLPRTRRGRELDVERRQVFLLDLQPVEAFELLDARLHLVGLRRLVAELLDELLGLLDHPLLVLVGGQLLRPPFGPQDHIFGVGNLVVGHLAQRQLDGAVGHVVQKSPVVRNQQHGAAVIAQGLLQPLDGFDVEVVGRLVEQKNRGTAQQQLGKLDAHAPAARKLARRTAEVLALETQPQERLLDVGVARLAAKNMVVVLRVVEPMEQLLVVGALVVGAFGDFARQPLDFGLYAQHLLERLGRLVGQGRGIGHAHGLRQVTDGTLAVDRHGARRRLLFARDDAQQRSLARAVLAHEPDAHLGVYQKRDIVEKGPAAVADRQVVQ